MLRTRKIQSDPWGSYLSRTISREGHISGDLIDSDEWNSTDTGKWRNKGNGVCRRFGDTYDREDCLPYLRDKVRACQKVDLSIARWEFGINPIEVELMLTGKTKIITFLQIVYDLLCGVRHWAGNIMASTLIEFKKPHVQVPHTAALSDRCPYNAHDGYSDHIQALRAIRSKLRPLIL